MESLRWWYTPSPVLAGNRALWFLIAAPTAAPISENICLGGVYFSHMRARTELS